MVRSDAGGDTRVYGLATRRSAQVERAWTRGGAGDAVCEREHVRRRRRTAQIQAVALAAQDFVNWFCRSARRHAHRARAQIRFIGGRSAGNDALLHCDERNRDLEVFSEGLRGRTRRHANKAVFHLSGGAIAHALSRVARAREEVVEKRLDAVWDAVFIHQARIDFKLLQTAACALKRGRVHS